MELSAVPVPNTFLDLVRSYPLLEINSVITCIPQKFCFKGIIEFAKKISANKPYQDLF